MKNAFIIFRKEIKEIIRNKNIWMPILIITLMFSVTMPLIFSMISGSIFEDEDTLKFMDKMFGSVENPERVFINFIIKQFLIFLLMIPAMVPSLIAPASVLMEKENNTLEPLLGTPIRTRELLFGKALTAMIPAFVISTANFLILTLVFDLVIYNKMGYAPLPTVEWLVVALILSPILSFILTMISVIVSSRSTDIRSAQGIGSVIILPIYLIIGLQIAGFFLINITYLLIGCLVFFIFCPILLRIAVRIFDRENILTKWKMKA
jgi:ABC-2 type transport system permease protein